MVSLDDKSAILIYRIGPVYCCSPSLPVENISIPGTLTHPPGTDTAHPGIFKHGRHIVSVSDLRYQFGVNENHWQHPGRMIITRLKDQHVGFWVDDIIDVVQFPESGWGNLPAQLPRGVFNRTLLLKNRIHLYAEFEKLQTLQGGGYLRQYISKLEQEQQGLTTKEKTTPLPDKKIIPGTKEIKPAQPVSATMEQTGKTDEIIIKSPETSATTPPPRMEKSAPSPATKMNVPGSPSVTGKPNAKSPATTRITNTNVAAKKTPSRTGSSQPVAGKSETPVIRATSNPVTTQKPMPRIEPPESSGLLALGVFIMLIIGAGTMAYYFLLTEPEKVKPQLNIASYADNAEQNYSIQNIMPTPGTETFINHETGSLSQDTRRIETEIDTGKITPAQEQYHASIEKDDQGITIIINAPKTDEPVVDIAPETESETSDIISNSIDALPVDSKAESTKPVTVVNTGQEPVANTPEKIEIIHIVVKGDTLWHIARRYVDNPFLYPELARLSNIKNPHRIYPGNRVRIIRYLN